MWLLTGHLVSRYWAPFVYQALAEALRIQQQTVCFSIFVVVEELCYLILVYPQVMIWYVLNFRVASALVCSRGTPPKWTASWLHKPLGRMLPFTLVPVTIPFAAIMSRWVSPEKSEVIIWSCFGCIYCVEWRHWDRCFILPTWLCFEPILVAYLKDTAGWVPDHCSKVWTSQ